MEYLKLVQNEFKVNDLEKVLKSTIIGAKSEAKKKFKIFLQNFMDTALEFQGGFKEYNHLKDHEYNRLILVDYLNIKNRLFELANSPLYSTYCNYKDPNEFLEKICAFIYNLEIKGDIKTIIAEIKIHLSEIDYCFQVIDFPRQQKNFTESELIKKNIVESEFFEQAYISSLEDRIMDLESDYFKEDDLFKKYYFNLNVVAISTLFHLFKQYDLFVDKMNLGKFCHLLDKGNSEYMNLNLLDSKLKVPEFGFLLQLLLNHFWIGDREEFLLFLSEKFIVVTSNNNYMDFSYHKAKHIIRLDSKLDETVSDNRKIIQSSIDEMLKLQ